MVFLLWGTKVRSVSSRAVVVVVGDDDDDGGGSGGSVDYTHLGGAR